jgi:hypothetical protein
MFVAEALGGQADRLTAEQRQRLAALDQLVPGDFAAVQRQVDILGPGLRAGRVPGPSWRASTASSPRCAQRRGMGF